MNNIKEKIDRLLEDPASCTLEEQRHVLNDLRNYLAELEKQNEALRLNLFGKKACEMMNDDFEHRQAEEALRQKDTMLARIASQVPGMLFQFMMKPDGSFSVPYSSQGVKDLFGSTPEEVRDDFSPVYNAIFHEDRDKILETIKVSGKNMTQWMCEFRVQLPGKPIRWLFGNSIPEKTADGSIIWSGYNMDITERKQVEEERKTLQNQLIQAQKIESIGRLAGGVAHDFNNMLSVILGFSEMAIDKMTPSDPIYNDLKEIYKAADRSTNIVRQLLAFSRQQTIAPKVLDLNGIIRDMLKMLKRLIGEDIDLVWLPGENIWPVKMDPSQIDQILANLCVNARDAIVDTGKIEIETQNICFENSDYIKYTGFSPGEYVMICISDDGVGMTPEVQEKLFEPFFTTKEVNKGTGMGLATVYGIVKQNNGFVKVYSEVELGTTFKVYLPRHTGKTEEIQKSDLFENDISGNETILLVEDEASILRMTTIMIRRQGYTVLKANTPDEAIRLAENYDGRIDMLITDVVMPGMNGRDLAGRLQALYPDLKCLFMSGYTANVIAHHGVLDEGVNFIQKPFSHQDLAVKIREVLNQNK